MKPSAIWVLMTYLFSTLFFHQTIFDVPVSTTDERFLIFLAGKSLTCLKKFGTQKIKKTTTKACQKSLSFELLCFEEYLSFMEYFLYENSTLMLKSVYNLNLCSVASIVRWHELNVGYFVWIHLEFKWKWAFCGWLEKCNYLVHLSR